MRHSWLGIAEGCGPIWTSATVKSKVMWAGRGLFLPNTSWPGSRLYPHSITLISKESPLAPRRWGKGGWTWGGWGWGVFLFNKVTTCEAHSHRWGRSCKKCVLLLCGPYVLPINCVSAYWLFNVSPRCQRCLYDCRLCFVSAFLIVLRLQCCFFFFFLLLSHPFLLASLLSPLLPPALYPITLCRGRLLNTWLLEKLIFSSG